jgi:hypothetical protein
MNPVCVRIVNTSLVLEAIGVGLSWATSAAGLGLVDSIAVAAL